jgi:pimeloyl-ACP methyl ester carboxylesterase
MKKIRLIGLVLCILGFNSPGYPVPISKKPESKPFPNSCFLTVDGMKLHFRIWPADRQTESAPWIFMVHGFCGSTFSWEYNAPVLAEAGYNVIAIDVPPFGYSDKDPDFNQSTDNRARLLWNFLNLIRPGGKWNLVGHSMGGGIVQCMAITNPGQVEKVVFADPVLFSNTMVKNQHSMPIIGFRPFEWMMVGIGKSILIKPKRIAGMLKSAYAQKPPRDDVDEYYYCLALPGTARALIRSSAKSKAVMAIDGKAFNKPAIAIWGEKDTWVPLSQMQPIADQIPSIKIIVIEGAGHCPMATHADQFNQQLLHFLDPNHIP